MSRLPCSDPATLPWRRVYVLAFSILLNSEGVSVTQITIFKNNSNYQLIYWVFNGLTLCQGIYFSSEFIGQVNGRGRKSDLGTAFDDDVVYL